MSQEKFHGSVSDGQQESEVQPRVFAISSKTPHQWLASESSKGVTFRNRVAGDIILNARELEPRIDWQEVVNCAYAVVMGRERHIGKTGIADSITESMGTVAANMGWNMDAPKVVYMSGYHFLWILGDKLDSLNKRLQSAAEITFLTEEAKEETLKKEKQTAGRLGIFHQRLGESLSVYARMNLPEEKFESYLEVLRSLSYLSRLKMSNERSKILKLVKAGSIEEASVIIARRKSSQVMS